MGLFYYQSVFCQRAATGCLLVKIFSRLYTGTWSLANLARKNLEQALGGVGAVESLL